MALLVMLCVPVVSIIISHKIDKQIILLNKNTIIEYFLDFLCLSFITNLVMSFFDKQNYINLVSQYSTFAVKYIILSVGISIVYGIIKKHKCVLERFKFIDFPKLTINSQMINCTFYLLTIFLCIFTLTRVSNSVFWGDEAFSIRLAKQPLLQILQSTASDVHPPLYYIFLRIAYIFLGNHYYTYNIVSMIPSILIAFFSVLVIKPKFGKLVSILFIILNFCYTICFSYNIEVRMYSWANFFVFMNLWYGINLIYDVKSKFNWVLFTLSGILAAYTHYYALISVFFIMISVYIVLIVKKFKNVIKCITSAVVCILLYLPWLGILLDSFKRTSDGWWSTYIPSFKSSLDFLFPNNITTKILFLMFIVGCIRFICIKYKQCITEKTDCYEIYFDKFKETCLTYEIYFIFFTIIAFIGTVGVGIVMSKLIRPMYLDRYSYAVMYCVLFSIVLFINYVSKMQLIRFFVILLVVIPCFTGSIIAYKDEYNSNQDNIASVEFIEQIYTDDYNVVTNIVHFNWTILECYLNCNSTLYNGINDAYKNNTTLLFYSGQLEENFIADIKKNHGLIEKIYSGYLGMNAFDLYKIEM